MTSTFLAAWLSCLLAQGTAAPVRDNAPTVPGAATLGGLVESDDASPKPLRRATVTLTAGGIDAPRLTTTDDAGRFEFRELRAGTYTVSVSKPGYVQTFYGSKKPGRGPGVPVAVFEQTAAPPLTLRMPHGAVITGTITQPQGRPAVGATVQIVPVQTVNGERRADIVNAAPALAGVTTDDRGVYRAFGLAPGDYLVLVRSLPQASAGGGARRVTPEEIQWAERVTSARMAQPGTSPQSVPAPPPAGPTLGMAPVYYPGTATMTAAVPITVGAGEVRSGVDFTTQLVQLATITGQVIDTDNRPAQSVRVSLTPVQADWSNMFGLLPGQAVTRALPDGRFEVSGVAPGRYTLTARGASAGDSTAPVPPGASVPASASALFFGGPPGGALWATEDITIDGRDVPGMVLRLHPGMTVAGRVVFEGTRTPSADELSRARIMLMTMPSGSSPLEMVSSMASGLSVAPVSADGSFAAKDVLPNRYRASVIAPGTGAAASAWSVKSITVNGREIADLPFDVRPDENVTGMLVTLTDHTTELSGTVSDQAGRPISNFPIVVFATDRAYWSIGSRRVQEARPSTDGRFRLSALPPGEYFVCVATDADPTSLYDPQYLEELAAGAFKITLAEGERKVQDVRLAN